MPIYAYKCSACGHAKDVLQKFSDTPLSVCPECGQATFSKQVTAAGFQLKGSGWYVTDFRNGSGGQAAAKTGSAKSGSDSANGDGAKSDSAKSDSATPAAAAAPAPAATPPSSAAS